LSFSDKLRQFAHAWNAFLDVDQDLQWRAYGSGVSYGVRPDRTKLTFTNEQSLISSIFTRISIDCAAVDIRHVRLDKKDRYVEDIKSGLNNCLTLEANLDQGARQFFQDVYTTLCDRGVAAIVPVDTSLDPSVTGSFDIQTMRVGEIVSWMPQHVRVMLYNEQTGRREEITVEKKYVAIVENPLYSVMNEPSSTMSRLIRKLNFLDTIDEQSSSGKLDLIIQLPYTVKSESRKQQANQRREEMERQLKGSRYGIAYADSVEKITQLNRPVENNLLKQVEYLVQMLYGQLGLTEAVMNGTADEATMLNYYNRTVEPMVAAVVQAMNRTFLTKTARSQQQAVKAFRDIFKWVTLKDFTEFADVAARNEILSSNELRGVVGIKPASDPNADKLMNSNMPQKSELPRNNQGGPAASPNQVTAPGSVGVRQPSLN
jgi:portal protein